MIIPAEFAPLISRGLEWRNFKMRELSQEGDTAFFGIRGSLLGFTAKRFKKLAGGREASPPDGVTTGGRTLTTGVRLGVSVMPSG